MIVGGAGAGTTALLTALCSAGARYYSDMFAVFDSTGRVHAYPTRRMSSSDLQTLDIARGETEPDSHARAVLSVALIVETGYRIGVRWRPRTLSPGQAAIALLQHVVPGRGGPAFVLRTLQRVCECAVMLRGRRGEADEVAHAILKRLDTKRSGGDAGRRMRAATEVPCCPRPESIS